MTKEVFLKKDNNEIRHFFTKEFEMILVQILSKLDIPIDFPTTLEELILSIPTEVYCSQCTEALYYINSSEIKPHLDNLIEIYENLFKYKESLFHKR